MKDQEIYKEIAQNLFDKLGSLDDVINLSACIRNTSNSVNSSVWVGETLSAQSGVVLTSRETITLSNLVLELNSYYRSENMGNWNVILYKLAPHGKSFYLEFEYNDDLAQGNLDLFKYRERFRISK